MVTPVPIIVLLSILGFFALIFGVRIKAILEYGEAFSLKISFLGIKIGILPSKGKKKVKLSDYTVEKIKKRQNKRLKKAEKAKLKKKAKQEKKKLSESKSKADKSAEKAAKPSVIAVIRLAVRLINILVPRFFKHIHVEIAKVNIKIASGDAATTAILYGAAYGALEALIAVLEKVNHLHSLKHADIHLEPDFIGDTIQAELKIAVSFRLASILGLLIKVGIKGIVGYVRLIPKQPDPKSAKEKAVN